MSEPLVSVVMNCYNGEKYLREAIESVYAQTYQNWEIIFWDNASIDKTAEIAKSYDAKLKYYTSKTTVPLGQARNDALAKCSGDYIVFLDCDDVYLPSRIEEQVKVFQLHDNAGLVYSNAYILSGEKETLLYKTDKMPEGEIFPALLRKYFLSLPTVMLKKDVLSSLDQLFDPNFEVAEEADLFFRVACSRLAYYVDAPLVKYRQHDQNLSLSKADRFPVELQLILDKLRMLYPRFDVDFQEEVACYKRNIAIKKALIAIKNRKTALARNALIPYIKSCHKTLGLYLLSFLGGAFAYRCLRQIKWF